MVTQLSVRDLARRLANDNPTYLVDVRQPWEHETAALPGSVLIPLNELADRAGEVRPPDGALVVVYCHHGVRSLRGAALLQHLGHAHVASLAGGIEAWSCEVDPGMPRY
jgi:adenylyltransferase/sulfurtransferase